MTIQEHANNASNELQAMLEEIVSSFTQQIDDWKQSGKEMTEEQKQTFLEKKKQLEDTYSKYKDMVKDTADDTKDDLAQKVGELQNKINEIDIQ